MRKLQVQNPQLDARIRTFARGKVRSHYRFVLLRVHFIPDPLTYLVPLFMNR